ncbi:30S ribosome-binding factor RbfA [Bdellovibrio sp. HCB2-146]|uniref:30S ribosome-binding factor RbfA n=1 Tax=Bdellovibrio sp. HCB2-146 TaxID=3394362 RepID=UPI0039BC5F09
MKNMGDGRRVARVEREIQATVAQFLLRDLRSELPGIVSVASVKMPADLRAAKVYISVIGTDEERDEVMDILKERAYEIQNYIGSELKMRYCPKLTFYSDTITEQVIKVDRILQELENERKAKGDKGSSEADDE